MASCLWGYRETSRWLRFHGFVRFIRRFIIVIIIIYPAKISPTSWELRILFFFASLPCLWFGSRKYRDSICIHAESFELCILYFIIFSCEQALERNAKFLVSAHKRGHNVNRCIWDLQRENKTPPEPWTHCRLYAVDRAFRSHASLRLYLFFLILYAPAAENRNHFRSGYSAGVTNQRHSSS